VLTRTRRRHVFGSMQYNFASRFLDEIPAPLLVHERSSAEQPETVQARDRGGSQRFDDGWSRDWDDTAPEPRPTSKAIGQLGTAAKPLPPKAGGAYKPGMRVVHPMFGTGTVRESDGVVESEKLIVQFQRFGLKKLVAHLARLEILG
jgi:DNA helicase-2/ATP-dependent DNA helicase PcrA